MCKTPIDHGRIEDLIRCVLRFWGAKPKDPKDIDARAPYHDLRLADPIVDPSWIVRFEEWMDTRRVRTTRQPLSGQTRNQYRSTMRQMYVLALRPERQKQTRIDKNPFDNVARSRPGHRLVTLTVDEMRAWVAAASYHVRLAVAIAALAPKLRLGNILALRWG